jgi:L-ascorbate metabolism protein UlaG (beta-lactamase superfamily)
MSTPIGFRWLGIAGVELTANGSTLLVDPCFTRPRWWHLGFGRVRPDARRVAEHIQAGDYVLVSHAHWDHLMDVPEVLRHTGGLALGSPNTCRLLAACGVPAGQVREMRAGQQLRLGDLSVTVLPAQHIRLPGFGPGRLSPRLRPPLRLRDYRMDDCFSFLVEGDGLRLLDWCGLGRAPAPPADVLCVAPYAPAAYYPALLRQVAPRLVVPVHWDDPFRPLSRPARPFFKAPAWAWPPMGRVKLAEFRRIVEETLPEAQVLIPEMLCVYDLGC